jgi:predicted RNA-binding protein associated with RNAse of E/G family
MKPDKKKEPEGSELYIALGEIGVPEESIEEAVDRILDLGFTEEEALDALDSDEVADILADYGDDGELDGSTESDVEVDDKAALIESLKAALNEGIIEPEDLKALLGEGSAEVADEGEDGDTRTSNGAIGGSDSSLAKLISSFKV